MAVRGFQSDANAMAESDACVLLLPCGRSAHLEAGIMKGRGCRLVIYLDDGEPELMNRFADALVCTHAELLNALNGVDPK